MDLSINSPGSGRVTDALLAAAGRGDATAFAAFFDETAAMVFGTLLRALRSPAAAERAAEDVYRRVWRRAPGFDPAVRSAYSTLLLATRRVVAETVHDQILQRQEQV